MSYGSVTMNQRNDYAYCTTTDCIHRRGCRRWVGNYEEFKASARTYYVDEKFCKPNYEEMGESNAFELLDRFRFSDGREFE